MAYIQRHLQESVLQLSGEYPVILICGPRDAGKTTLFKMLIDMEKALPAGALGRESRIPGLAAPSDAPREVVTLDDLAQREIAVNDPELFLQMHQPPVLISEVQYAPELLPFIKKTVDENKRPGDFWLTGSSLYELMEAVQASLAGDVAFLNMFPLSASEIDGRDLSPFRVDRNYLGSISRRRVQAPEIFEKIWGGGMPAVRGNRYAPSEYYAGYVQRCINRDVRDISGNIDPLKFMRFLTVTAGHCAELLNVKAIAEAAEIDQVTAKNWLTILASLGLIFYMHPFQHEVLHRTVKAPKLYFYDTGLVCWLTKWNSPGAAMSGAMAPQLFENFAVSEIIKGYCHHGAVPRIWYYRDRDSAEIDLVIEDDGELHPVEIRMTAKPTRRMTSSFVLLDREPLKRGLGAVITLNEKLSALTAETLVVPVSYL